MSHRLVGPLLPSLLLALAPPAVAHEDGDNLPPGFSIEPVLGPFEQLTGFAFDHLDRMLFWQKKGLLWILPGGDAPEELLLDLTEEVGNWGDHGLHGVALDPDYANNGFVYLYYVVDHHHLMNFGTPAYDPLANHEFVDTQARVARYTVSNPYAVVPVIDPASRVVLVGDAVGAGIPITSHSHGIGPLNFASDGTLLFAAGDGYLSGSGSGTAFADGITKSKEEVLGFRSQLIDSHGGKVLRIDPATGEGVPSNPFYSAAAPRSPRSRVWALGLRNPFQWSIRPGTGSDDPADADPGTLYIGDVGSSKWEEIDVAPTGGLNFGWPVHEGYLDDTWRGSPQFENLDAPNPLAGSGCPQHFIFQDLLVQDSLNPPSWPNPCDPATPIPSSIPTFMHTRPILVWGHQGLVEDPTLVKGYDAFGEAITIPIDDESSAAHGEPFEGNCVIGGTWYHGTAYPAEWEGRYIFAEFGERMLFYLETDENDELQHVHAFGSDVGAITRIAPGPGGEELYFIDYYGSGGSRINKLAYGSLHPSVQAQAQPSFGSAPLRVELQAETNDPLGQGLTYAWDFGDGSPISPVNARPNPTHVYPAEDITAGGAIVTKLDELNPPSPMGLGNPSPEIFRDGFYQSEGATAPVLQFDTVHVDAQIQPDKNGEDYLGYVFPGERLITGVIYQEGLNSSLGGWFEAMTVQVREASTGVWRDVTGLLSQPAYPGDTELSFETFQLLFDPVLADGVRLHGVPGGSFEYVSASELRVLATPDPAAGLPEAFQATVTVTDGLGEQAQESASVSTNNSPPKVVIVSPPNGMSYSATGSTPLALNASVSDNEHAPGELQCEWSVKLVHDNHVHPEPLDNDCATSTTLFPHGDLIGDVVYYEVELTVTDPLGLATTVRHYAVQANDCNLNGFDDLVDVATGVSLDENFDGIPDECQTDCNQSGVHDTLELLTGSGFDDNLSGTLDECEPVLLDVSPGIPGIVNQLAFQSAEPGSLVALIGGLVAQPLPLTLCNGMNILISDPVLMGFLTADATGHAAANFMLPDILAPGTTLYFQAIDGFACEASNLVDYDY